MIEISLVSIGAILGANIRFKIQNKLEKSRLRKNFLILIINTLASFSLGLFLSIIESLSSFIYSYELVLFFSIGFLGSFSTFSSFVYDLFELCLQLKFSKAFRLCIISLSLGVIAFSFGLFLGNE